MNNHQSYVPAERQKKIIQYVQQHGRAKIRELSDWLDVSEATVRRDLDELDLSGNLERTHGGAVYKKQGTAYERRYEEKMTLMETEKRAIAAAALKEISAGDTLFLDSGTSCYYLASILGQIPDLTVFTYDLMVAYGCELSPTSEMIVTGGIRRPGHNNVLLGTQVIECLEKLRVDKVFLGADAIDAAEVTNSNYSEAEIKSATIDAGDQIFLLADHSKFGKRALSRVCSLDRIDTLITDSGISARYREEMENTIRRVIIAS